MYTLLHMIEDMITDGLNDTQILAVALGTNKDLKETKETLKNTRKNLKISRKRKKK